MFVCTSLFVCCSVLKLILLVAFSFLSRYDMNLLHCKLIIKKPVYIRIIIHYSYVILSRASLYCICLMFQVLVLLIIFYKNSQCCGTVAAVQLAHKFGAPPSVKESRPFLDLSLTTHDLPFAQRL